MSNPEMGVPPVAQSEMTGPIDYAERLRKYFTPDTDAATEHRERFWLVANQVASLAVGPGHRRAVELYAGIVDWSMFGGFGNALPEGLLLTGPVDEPVVTYDHQVPYMAQVVPSYIPGKLLELGQDEIGRSLLDKVEPDRPAVETLLADFIRQTPEYQLLASLDRPEHTQRTSPLDHYWRLVRQGQIEQEIRRSFGLNHDDAIEYGTPAHQELSRGLYHLDEEFMPVRTPESGREGMQRARAYVSRFIEGIFNKKYRPYVFDKIIPDDSAAGANFIRYRISEDVDSEYDDVMLSQYSDWAGDEFSKAVYSGPAELRYVGSVFARLAFEKIFDNDSQSLPESLDVAISSAVKDCRGALQDFITGRELLYSNWAGALIRQPSGGVASELAEGLYYRAQQQYDWYDPFRRRASLVTSAEIRNQRSNIIGQIEEYGPDNSIVTARMLLSVVRNDAGFEERDEDLVLKFETQYDTTVEPFVPGYRLVSRDDSRRRFGFAADPNGDPYASCDVPINEQGREVLASAYDELGLGFLASQTRSRAELTVAELEALIKQQAVYYIPDNIHHSPTREDSLNFQDAYIEGLQNFSRLVRSGRLYTQCSGADLFLQCSLNLLFGEGSTSTVEGLSIKPGRPIDAVRHAQTVFVHEGMRYILDATPTTTVGGDDYMPSGNASAFDRSAEQVHKGLKPGIPQQAPETSRPERPPEDHLEMLIDSFIERMRVAFDLPNTQKSAELLVRLSPQDPTRRTFELLRRYRAGYIGHEELEEQAGYVAGCSGLTRDVRRRLGIDHYSQAFLEQLRSTIWRLQSIARDAEASGGYAPTPPLVLAKSAGLRR